MRNGASLIPAPDPEREAQLRLSVGVVACIGLLVLLVVGLAFAAGSQGSPALQILGGCAVLAAVIGIVLLLRWARDSAWTYDRPSRGLSLRETFLVGVGAVILFVALYEPLGIWALCAFALPIVPIACLRYGLSRTQAFGAAAVLCITLLAAALA